MVEDEKQIIYNYIDLRNQNKIIIPDLEIYRRELNKIRNTFISRNSEIYIQKNQDMVGIIRIITDNKCLINDSLEKNKIELYKNVLSDENIFEELDNNEDGENIEQQLNKKLIISNSNNDQKNSKLSKNELLSKSFEYLNILDNNIILN